MTENGPTTETNPRYKIGFIGMTHLGINSAVAAAAKGFSTYGFDQSVECIENLKRNILPVAEPDLGETLANCRSALSFTHHLSDLNGCDLVYIAPDIPTDDHGKSDESDLCELIIKAEKHLDDHIPFVIVSQVTPGFTDTMARKLNRRLYYQVETLIFGQALKRALYPERIIVGSKAREKPLHQAYAAFLATFECPILIMRYQSAELAKIAINCCLVSCLSVANTLAEICENMQADWSEILPALKLDKRIGPDAYLRPGLGISGGNLERDLQTVLQLSAEYGTHCATISSWMDNSDYRKDWPLRILLTTLAGQQGRRKAGEAKSAENREEAPPIIAILGIAYKKDTHSVKNSPALRLIKNLPDHYKIQTYDPAVAKECDEALGARRYPTALGACKGAHAVLIMTDWEEFRTLELAEIHQQMAGDIVIDPYAIFRDKISLDRGNYHTLGVTKNGPG